MLSGTVTNMMTGKGFFQLNYRGEILSGKPRAFPATSAAASPTPTGSAARS